MPRVQYPSQEVEPHTWCVLLISPFLFFLSLIFLRHDFRVSLKLTA